MESQPELNNPSLKSPVPCYWGASCYYTDCCRFVHPGEEGMGRKLFPARITFNKETNSMIFEAPVVRLIGSATFYERRRKGLSWPQWLKKKPLHLLPLLQQKRIMCGCNIDPVVINGFCTDCYWENEERCKYEALRAKLFPVIYTAFLENQNTLLECGMSHPNITPGKIVENMLYKYSIDKLYGFLADDVMMGHVMYEMYEKVLEDEKNVVRRIVF